MWIESGKRKKQPQWYSVSPSALSDFIECDRCGYRRVHRISPPRGKFPSLPNGVDGALKQMSNLHRARGRLPPLWGGLLPGRRLFPEPPRSLTYRCQDLHLTVTGIPDEWIIEEDGDLSVLDFKTRGFPKKELYPSYQLQAHIYGWLSTRFPSYPRLSSRGYLIYFIPELHGQELAWTTDMHELEVRPRIAKQFLNRVADVIHGPMPKAAPDCEMCAWAERTAHGLIPAEWSSDIEASRQLGV